MMAKINKVFPYSSLSHFLLMKEFSLMASCTSWNQISSRNLQLECSILIMNIITISLSLPHPTFLLLCLNGWSLPNQLLEANLQIYCLLPYCNVLSTLLYECWPLKKKKKKFKASEICDIALPCGLFLGALYRL